MKVLVIGGGGSMHALVWKLLDDSRVQRVYCAPGNGGTALMAYNVAYTPGHPKELAGWAWGEGIDLTLVADDAVLDDGVVQAFRFLNLTILAPEAESLDACISRAAARALFARLDIPTLPGSAFDDAMTLEAHTANRAWPLRLRPDSACTNTWTAIVRDAQEAHQAARTILGESLAMSSASPRVLVEEHVPGVEVGVSAFVMGAQVGPAVLSRTHYHREDGDRGPVTDGLGACSPLRRETADWVAGIRSQALEPLAQALDYRGVLHLDVLLTQDGEWLALGLRAAFGDPEAQAVLPRLGGSLLDALDGAPVSWSDQVSCAVVLAEDGYPSAPGDALPITGLDTLDPGVLVFHGDTALSGRKWDFSKSFSPLIASGGRVLTVVGLGVDHDAARARAYANAERIQFHGVRYRREIGSER